MSETKDQSLASLRPGDRVQVFDVNGKRMGQPEGGWDGTVTKVGRQLIYVDYPGARGVNGDAFRLDSGLRNDQYCHQSIQTVEQAAENLRRDSVIERLREGGLELTRRVEISTDTLEAVLAALESPRITGPQEN
jgi:hypothetical protein